MARASACPAWPLCDPLYIAWMDAVDSLPDAIVLAALDAAEAER
jgi:hypothetical protein